MSYEDLDVGTIMLVLGMFAVIGGLWWRIKQRDKLLADKTKADAKLEQTVQQLTRRAERVLPLFDWKIRTDAKIETIETIQNSYTDAGNEHRAEVMGKLDKMTTTITDTRDRVIKLESKLEHRS